MAAICSTLGFHATNLIWNLMKKLNFLNQVYFIFFIVSRGLRMISIVDFSTEFKYVWLKKIPTEVFS